MNEHATIMKKSRYFQVFFYIIILFWCFTVLLPMIFEKKRNNDDFSKTAEKHFKYNNTEYLVEHLNEYWKWFI